MCIPGFPEFPGNISGNIPGDDLSRKPVKTTQFPVLSRISQPCPKYNIQWNTSRLPNCFGSYYDYSVLCYVCTFLNLSK